MVIGSAHFVFEDEACTIPDGEQERFDTLPEQYSHLYLAIGGQLAAVICISDPLRTEAAAVINALRRLGIQKTVMLTGDSERTAAAIAAQVGVDEYRAEVLPEDKARFVEEERAQGHTVMMLGDGINDSPALSAADVGIAISDGAAIAREIADITIAADDLFELVSLADGRQQPDAPHPIELPLCHRFQWGSDRAGRRGRPPPGHLCHAAQPLHVGRQPAEHDKPVGLTGVRPRKCQGRRPCAQPAPGKDGSCPGNPSVFIHPNRSNFNGRRPFSL